MGKHLMYLSERKINVLFKMQLLVALGMRMRKLISKNFRILLRFKAFIRRKKISNFLGERKTANVCFEIFQLFL